MFCTECGKEINNDVKFCPFCGLKILEIKDNSESLNKVNRQPDKDFDKSEGFSFGEISSDIKNKLERNIEIDRDTSRNYSQRRETSLGSKVIAAVFYMWLLNTFLANANSWDRKWEEWYIPGLSEITPMLVQETKFLGGGSKYRLASQAELWRVIRTRKNIKEGIEYFLK